MLDNKHYYAARENKLIYIILTTINKQVPDVYQALPSYPPQHQVYTGITGCSEQVKAEQGLVEIRPGFVPHKLYKYKLVRPIKMLQLHKTLADK